jgi:hypothetical protein
MDTNAWSENLKERNHLENVGVYRRMILKCILFAWLRVGRGSCKKAMEFKVKCGEFVST